MMKAIWQSVHGAHRKAHRDHSHLMFVACSESVACAGFLAAFPTAYVVQTLAGPARPVDAATHAAVVYGALQRGIRHVVVCGHSCCRADGAPGDAEQSQALAVARCRAIQDDAALGPILRGVRASLQPLWFDEVSHDIYTFDLDGSAKRMGHDDLASMFTRFDRLSV